MRFYSYFRRFWVAKYTIGDQKLVPCDHKYIFGALACVLDGKTKFHFFSCEILFIFREQIYICEILIYKKNVYYDLDSTFGLKRNHWIAAENQCFKDCNFSIKNGFFLQKKPILVTARGTLVLNRVFSRGNQSTTWCGNTLLFHYTPLLWWKKLHFLM